MNVSFRWLQELAPGLEGTPEAAAERLAQRGFPVEQIRVLGQGLRDVVAAKVHAVRPHPDADRLRICEVDGGNGTVQVVCGAPNVAPGGFYPFAPVGATLPGGMVIGRARLRGEVSEGMLCSERELGLGPGEAGLMELDGPLTPGRPLVGLLGLDDVRLDVEVTSNRPDLLSHEGVARELASEGHPALVLPGFPGEEAGRADALDGLAWAEDSTEASGGGATVRIEAPELCSRYLALVVRGVEVGPSPPWLQARLRAVGARPVNNVVDATNYVLLELGQPLHAFDLARVRGSTIVVRRAREGERLRTLDGTARALSREMLAICDAEGPVAVAGIMGGLDSEVGGGTRDVLLECARFAPGSIRATRKALGLSTDASYRFERGVDPERMQAALLRAARLILLTAGGAVPGPIVSSHPRPFARQTIPLRVTRVSQVLGVHFEPEVIVDLLEPLGFTLEAEEDGVLSVEVPGFRSHDVTREIDLIEEIARTWGYDRFPDTLGPFRPGTVPDHPLFALEDRIRSELTAGGFFEAQTPAFAPAGEGEVEILNPVSSEEGFLRSRLLPGLIRRLEHNAARGNRDVRLFELGTVFAPGDPGELPREATHLAVVMHGLRAPRHWSGDAADLDLWDLKGWLERIAPLAVSRCRLGEAGRDATAWGPFVPGSTLVVQDRDGELRGAGGPLVAGAIDLPPWAGTVFGIEIVLPGVPEIAPDLSYEPIPTHPGAERDLALLLPDQVRIGQVLEVARREGGEHLRDLGVFDVYRDPGMAEGKRSVAVRLRFRAADRTLKDREVDDAVRRIAKALEEELDAGIRGRQS